MTHFYYIMRKRIFGRRLKRDVNQRKALFKSLIRSLVIYGGIQTTRAKAKSIKGEAEKLITYVKNNQNGAERYLLKSFSKDVAQRIITDIAPKFQDRNGGYTQIINIGPRVKDNAPMVLMRWVEDVGRMEEKTKKTKRKNTDEKVKSSRKKYLIKMKKKKKSQLINNV